MGTYRGLFLMGLVVLFIGFSPCGEAAAPAAVRGRLDLSGWDLAAQPAKLDGAWEFYWGELLGPADFRGPSARHASAYQLVPGAWRGLPSDSGHLSGKGFATYRLRATLPPSVSPDSLVLAMPYARTAYRLFANGQLISENGAVSADLSAIRPQYLPRTASLPLETGPGDPDTVEIIIQVANAHFRSGGLPKSIVLGVGSEVGRSQEQVYLTEMFLVGIMAFMALYHMVLYLWNPDRVSVLYFALFTVTLAVRTFFTGSMPFFVFLPLLPWEVHLRIEYVTSFVAPYLFVAFLRSMFPSEVFPAVTRAVGALAAVGGLSAVFLPVRMTSEVIPSYTAIVGGIAIYSAWALVQAVRRKREASWLMMGGGLTFLGAVVFTMFHYNLVWVEVDLLPFGMFALLSSQALAVSWQQALAFRRETVLVRQNAHLLDAAHQSLAERKRLFCLLAKQDERIRRSVAEMLHGRTQARLFAVRQWADQAMKTVDGDPSEARRLMQTVHDAVDQIREEDIREASHRLHPAVIAAGLIPALESLLVPFEEGYDVEFVADPEIAAMDDPRRKLLPENVRLGLYRIVEEALNNIRRHSGASRISVRLGADREAGISGEVTFVAASRDDDGSTPDRPIELLIGDDGAGFDPARSSSGLGLQLIAARTADLGGEWQVMSAPGEGTRVKVVIPVPR